MSGSENQKYPMLLRALHWLIALIIVGMVASGWVAEEFDDEVPRALVGIHKSFGALLIFLVVIRIVVRLSSRIPELPEKLDAWEKKLAHATHGILYLLMLAVPVGGYLMSNAYGYSVRLFSIPLPKVLERNKELGEFLREVHGVLPYVLLAIVIIHVAGALKHRFVDKDPEKDVLDRML